MTKHYVVHAYCRCSTTDQTVEQQQDAIRSAYPEEVPIQFYCERTSGWSGKRSEFAALVNEISKGRVKEVVACNIARLGRNQRECVNLLDMCVRANVKIRILDTQIDFSGPLGAALWSLFSAFAQMDSDTKSNNIKRALMLKKKLDPSYRCHGKCPGVDARTKEKASLVYELLDRKVSIRMIARQVSLSTTNVQKIKRLRGYELLTPAEYAARYPGWHLLPREDRPKFPRIGH